MSDVLLIQPLTDCADPELVGGKAANLGRLLRAGFPVPGGFVVTTHAYEFALKEAMRLPDEAARQVLRAYREVGAGVVAVRSSATAEDTAGASMAGQFDTFLSIEGEAALLDAIARCWAGLHSARTRAYFQLQSIDLSKVRMAVIVQRLVNADVAGVLFTANPRDGNSHQAILEAARGLGEGVVSGSVRPDSFMLDAQTGAVIEQSIAGATGPCLLPADIERLRQLGLRVAETFGAPQDIEWAIASGEISLLQSRPITTLGDAEADADLLRSTRERLTKQAALGRGPWVAHNLAETLPHPTALSWSIVSESMSGRGGLGRMYRLAGFSPSPLMNREGFLELIAGRIYMDAARAPEMFFEGVALAYDIDELRRNPASAQAPPSAVRGSMLEKMCSVRRLAIAGAALTAFYASTEDNLRKGVFLEVLAFGLRSRAEDLQPLTTAQFIEKWREWEDQVLGDFAAQLFAPGMIAGIAMGELRDVIAEHLWDEDADALAASIASIGSAASRSLKADAELYEVGCGTRSLEQWLANHGHRGAGEFDLASPRWRECPLLVREMAERMARGENPLERHARRASEVAAEAVALRERLPAGRRATFDFHADRARRYVSLREDAKDYLMFGYERIRALALEAGRRLGIGSDVFHLTRDEVFESLVASSAPAQLIAQRKSERRAEGRLELPRIIESADIGSLGESRPPPASDGALKATALSAGRATGPARVLLSPTDARDIGRGYILVCPSTDPSWTPLFADAAGLVLERGGMLSHGAVVAREVGLPAVVLPDACRILTDGQTVHIDAKDGWVTRASTHGSGENRPQKPDANDTSVPRTAMPPSAGMKLHGAVFIASIVGAMWAILLLAVFLLPASWVYRPLLQAIDWVLWPLVRWLGGPGVVALIAAGMAALTMLVQKIATDNVRMSIARARADALSAEARTLPSDSPRRAALMRIVSGVSLRALVASLVPIGLLLGPMVMSFAWLKERVDVSAVVAMPGEQVQVVALVDADYAGELTLEIPVGVSLDGFTGRAQTCVPVRPTLERLLALYHHSPQQATTKPWEFDAAPDGTHEALAADLQAYLERGIPPQRVSWVITPTLKTGGRFFVGVTPEEGEPTLAPIVVGDEVAPAPPITFAAASSPVREVRIVYPRPTQQKFFLRPLAWLPASFAPSQWDIGWVWLYVAVYLPVMLHFRRLLRVA